MKEDNHQNKALESGIIYISARKGYIFDGLRASGCTVYSPYIDHTIVGRILREIWFFINLPEQIWYSKKCLKHNPEKIILHDPLLTANYIKWLQKKFPSAQINFEYGNLIGKAKHLTPLEIPEKISISTYDAGDSKKFNIKLRENGNYFPCYIGKKKSKKYDVFFIGADKGRGDYILELERQMKILGMKTKFIITADGMFSKRKTYYSKRISYLEVIEYDNESRSILNIVLPGQMGATLRDYESIFNEVKLITNNKNIKNFDFYDASNVFILGEQKIEELPTFLSLPYKKIDQKILQRHLLRFD